MKLIWIVVGMLLSGWLMAAELKPCPESPNCVSSQATTEQHRIAPLAYQGEMAAAQARLKQVLLAMPRVELVAESAGALHVTQMSFVFRFVDDVEFIFDDAAKMIHVRSASRTGYSDFGVNRERVEEIRALFASSVQ